MPLEFCSGMSGGTLSLNISGPMRIYPVKENYIGSVISEILRYTQTNTHTQIDILLFYYKVCKLIDCRDGGGRLSLGGRLEGAQDQRKKTDDDRRRSDLHICLFRNRDTALERNLFIQKIVLNKYFPLY